MNDAHVLTFAGELDMSRKLLIVRELERIERFGRQSVTILDLTRVTYLDSTFFNALVRVQKHAFNVPPDGRICVVMRRSYGYRLFQLTKFDQVFPLFDDLAAAYGYANAKFPGTSAIPGDFESVDMYRVTRSAPNPAETDAGPPEQLAVRPDRARSASGSPDLPESSNQAPSR
jgi:anti-anti-sigma factor